MIVCAGCGGARVEVAKWVDPNTMKVNESPSVYDAILDEDTGSTLAHCMDCKDYVRLEEATPMIG